MYTMTMKTMNALEGASADYEKLIVMMEMLDKMVWGDLMNAHIEGENYQDIAFRLGCMTDTLLVLIKQREREIEQVIIDVVPVKEEATA